MNTLWKHEYPYAVEDQGNTLPTSGAYSVRKDIAAEVAAMDWNLIIWRKVRKPVSNLQKRIYKATKAGSATRLA